MQLRTVPGQGHRWHPHQFSGRRPPGPLPVADRQRGAGAILDPGCPSPLRVQGFRAAILPDIKPPCRPVCWAVWRLPLPSICLIHLHECVDVSAANLKGATDDPAVAQDLPADPSQLYSL